MCLLGPATPRFALKSDGRHISLMMSLPIERCRATTDLLNRPLFRMFVPAA
jgi:hypothetical protein